MHAKENHLNKKPEGSQEPGEADRCAKTGHLSGPPCQAGRCLKRLGQSLGVLEALGCELLKVRNKPRSLDIWLDSLLRQLVGRSPVLVQLPALQLTQPRQTVVFR